MGLKKLAEKVAAYNARLEEGKAHKIEPGHVRKVIDKLRAKEEDLLEEIGEASSEEKRARLERKLQVAREQIARAEYVLSEVS